MTELVGITPNIGSNVDLDAQFTDSTGEKKSLKDFFVSEKPSIIVPVYFHCPRLCGLVMAGLFDTLKQVTLYPGTDYNLAFVSFDPTEKLERAVQRKEAQQEKLKGSHIALTQFNFLIGEAEPVKTLMMSLGFHYKEDGETDFAHTAAIMILSPQGEITHYFTGIEFNPQDLRLALVEASKGEVGTFVDHVLLYCFRFDPTKGKYTWAALNIMKAGGIITLIALGSLFRVLWTRYRI